MPPPALGGTLSAYRYELQICFDILTDRQIMTNIPVMAAFSSIDSASISRSKAAVDAADPSFATTLAHGLDVLAVFRNGSGSLSNADLAASTGLSRPTVSR